LFRPITLILAAFGIALSATSAHAILIDSVLNSLGSNAYRYDYTVTNDGSLPGGADLESLDIDFPSSTISAFSDLPAWDEFTLPSLGDDLFAMDAIPGPGLASGDSLSFFVEFQWSGTDIPQPQAFTIYDLNTLAVIETGTTDQSLGAGFAPLPGTLWLAALGGVFLGASKRRYRNQ